MGPYFCPERRSLPALPPGCRALARNGGDVHNKPRPCGRQHLLSRALKAAWTHINEKLVAAFSGWSPVEWLEKHTAVSNDDFLVEPHRNRYTVVLSRNTHMAFHFGQAILADPKDQNL